MQINVRFGQNVPLGPVHKTTTTTTKHVTQ